MIQKQKECSQSALIAVHLSLVVDGLFACFLLVDLFSGCVEDFEFAVFLGRLHGSDCQWFYFT